MSEEKKTATKTTKKILISQARPESEKSPYFDLERKHKVSLHFHPLIELIGIPSKDFRKNKIDIATFSAVIFTSKHAIDHFFRTCDELKLSISQDTKYFCVTESVAFYGLPSITQNIQGPRTHELNADLRDNATPSQSQRCHRLLA